MIIFLAADHAGYELKEKIVKYLDDKGLDYKDYGTNTTERCDYNEAAKKVAEAVASNEADRGILICGTGVGMSIQANKQKGIRAALVHDVFTAEATRLHNNSNVLCMGGRIIGVSLAECIVETWLKTEFSAEERHVRRVNKIEE